MAHRRPGRPAGAQPSAEERLELLVTAAEAAIVEHGAGVSMEQIAERAEVSKATLYDNFDGKAGLTAALVDRYGQRLLEAYGTGLSGSASPEQVLRVGIKVFVRHIEANSELYRFVVRNSTDDALLDEVAAPIARFFRSLLDGDEVADRADALAVAAVGTVVTATERWCHHRRLSRSRFEVLLADYVWGGLVAAGVRSDGVPVDLSAVAEAVAEARARR
jgi:AcrR family transcriptional regulator